MKNSALAINSKDNPEAGNWPRYHLLGAGCLSSLLLVLLVLVPPGNVEAKRTEGDRIDIDVAANSSPNSDEEQVAKAAAPEQIRENAALTMATVVTGPTIDWQTITVANGDSLSLLFKRVGLQANDMQELLNTCPDAAKLAMLHPGGQFAFHIENRKLQGLRYIKSALEAQEFSRQGDHFVAKTVFRDAEKRIQYRRAVLDDSLFMAGQDAGLSQNVIMQLANVFGGVIDFVLDPRSGDSFSILFEELYLDGEKISTGKILSAEYINRGKSLVAYRYEDSDGQSGYYAPDGVSMQKAFLRAPLDFARISSPFSLRRLHPIHKRIQAHRGIDYVAPRGTPVYAAGDGRVVRAGYTAGNGNYLVVTHGQQFTTKYLHLSKRHVKQAQKVEKGQIIGNVGSTGYATGPHLHYEFLVDGVHRNPRTILSKLPKARSIPTTEMDSFRQQVMQLQTQLADHQNAYQLASGEASANDGAYSLTRPLATADGLSKKSP